MKLVDEKNDILHLADLIHQGLDPLLELATVFRTGNHQREVECHDFFVAQNFRHIARGYFLSKAFDDRRLADARFTDQHRVVLGAAAENLDDTLDFRLTPDHWIEPAFFGDLGEVTTKGLERRGLGLTLAFGAGSLDLAFILEGTFSTLDVVVVIVIVILRREIRINLGENFVAGALDIDIEPAQHAGRDTLTFTQQTKQKVLGTNIRMVERLRFLVGEREDLLHPWCVRDVTGGFLRRTRAHLFFHLHAHGIELEAHAFEHIHRDPLAELDEPQQQVLGADIGMVETVCLLAGKGQYLLGAWCEVVHESPGLLISEEASDFSFVK